MRFSKTLTLVAPALILAAAGPPARAADCDRACLGGFVTKYLTALVAHNPAALPLAKNARFTEDGVTMKLGEGLWKDASAIGTYRQDVLDVRQATAASLVVMEESGTPVLLSLRLKIADQKISQVETMATRTRKEGGLFNLDGLKTADPRMAKPPEPSQLATRDEAIRIAEHYPAGLKVGSFVTADAPFASDAFRLENGVITAGQGCSRAGCEDIKTQKIMEHPGITQQVVAVDEELGIVLLRMNFGQTNSYGPGNSLHVFEAFKVYGGQIHEVAAFMKILPENAPYGWE